MLKKETRFLQAFPCCHLEETRTDMQTRIETCLALVCPPSSTNENAPSPLCLMQFTKTSRVVFTSRTTLIKSPLCVCESSQESKTIWEPDIQTPFSSHISCPGAPFLRLTSALLCALSALLCFLSQISFNPI